MFSNAIAHHIQLEISHIVCAGEGDVTSRTPSSFAETSEASSREQYRLELHLADK